MDDEEEPLRLVRVVPLPRLVLLRLVFEPLCVDLLLLLLLLRRVPPDVEEPLPLIVEPLCLLPVVLVLPLLLLLLPVV